MSYWCMFLMCMESCFDNINLNVLLRMILFIILTDDILQVYIKIVLKALNRKYVYALTRHLINHNMKCSTP